MLVKAIRVWKKEHDVKWCLEEYNKMPSKGDKLLVTVAGGVDTWLEIDQINVAKLGWFKSFLVKLGLISLKQISFHSDISCPIQENTELPGLSIELVLEKPKWGEEFYRELNIFVEPSAVFLGYRNIEVINWIGTLFFGVMYNGRVYVYRIGYVGKSKQQVQKQKMSEIIIEDPPLYTVGTYKDEQEGEILVKIKVVRQRVFIITEKDERVLGWQLVKELECCRVWTKTRLKHYISEDGERWLECEGDRLDYSMLVYKVDEY